MGKVMDSQFQSKLSALVAKQLTGDADAIAEAIERLTDSLGLAVAVSCGGDITRADDMMTGVDGYLAECVANHAKLAQFMALAKPIATRSGIGGE
jgi:hypothetical protein